MTAALTRHDPNGTPPIGRDPALVELDSGLGEKLIDAATIRPSTFATFADCISAAHRMTQPEKPEKPKPKTSRPGWLSSW